MVRDRALRLSRIDLAALTTSEGHPNPDRLRRELEREYVRLNLDRLGIVLPKRMRLAEHELSALAASA